MKRWSSPLTRQAGEALHGGDLGAQLGDALDGLGERFGHHLHVVGIGMHQRDAVGHDPHVPLPVDEVAALHAVEHVGNRHFRAELGLPESRFLMTLDHTGNTSGATIPIALDEFQRQGVLRPGDRVLMPAVGAGMAWGALYVTWALDRTGPEVGGDAPGAIDLRSEPTPVGAGADR